MKDDPKEVKEMRASLDNFAKTARRATRTSRASQRNLRLSLVPESGYDAPFDTETTKALARAAREG
jgi:hypothetical protein